MLTGQPDSFSCEEGFSPLAAPDSGDFPAVLELKEDEIRLLDESIAYLDASDRQNGAVIRREFAGLETLGRTIARMPPAGGAGEDAGPDQLLESLGAFGPARRPLRLPGRAAGARSFLVAKCRAFSLLARMLREEKNLYQAVRRLIFLGMYALLAEDACLSCIADGAFPARAKYGLTVDLLWLWATGTGPRMVDHFPSLEALWTVRDNCMPNFGSMTGASELLHISIELDNDWKDFVVSQLEREETLAALEEFLFGLSWEEVRVIRSRLAKIGTHAVNRSEVSSFLKDRQLFTTVSSGAPRTMVEFFIDRREMASHRKLAGADGPHRTLEELYLSYRLARQAERGQEHA